MQNTGHEIEFQSPDMFNVLLDHEVNRSRRYGDSLTLIVLMVETEPSNAEARQVADAVMVGMLKLHLRDTDILCKHANEFRILLPATSTPGARTACERLRKLIPAEHQAEDGSSLRLSTFIGMASMSVDHSVSSAELAQNATRALDHARTNHSPNTVAFSEIK